MISAEMMGSQAPQSTMSSPHSFYGFSKKQNYKCTITTCSSHWPWGIQQGLDTKVFRSI